VSITPGYYDNRSRPLVTTPPSRTMSLVALCISVGSVLFSFGMAVGVIAGVAAIVVGIRARAREPEAPRWMTTTAILTGIAGLLVSLAWSAFIIYFSVILPLTLVGELPFS